MVNNDLANTIGNLLNRTSSMARRWFDGAVPPAGAAAAADHPLALRCLACAEAVDGALEALDFRTAAAAILELAEAANGFLNDRAPWKAIKAEEGRAGVAEDLYAVLETSRWVAVLLAPPAAGSFRAHARAARPAASGGRQRLDGGPTLGEAGQ